MISIIISSQNKPFSKNWFVTQDLLGTLFSCGLEAKSKTIFSKSNILSSWLKSEDPWIKWLIDVSLVATWIVAKIVKHINMLRMCVIAIKFEDYYLLSYLIALYKIVIILHKYELQLLNFSQALKIILLLCIT